MAEASTESVWMGGLPYRLWRANQVVTRHVATAMEDLGVTVTQLGITIHIDELGNMSASDLARLFRLTPQSVTTALNRLEQLGWVSRLPHPSHGRVIWYEVTEAGRAAAHEGRRRITAVNAEVDALLSPGDHDVFVRGLGAITAQLDGAELPQTVAR
ncbi:MarR family transcriptional regulator [Microbacterium sp. LRZ72]|uniref:MarR family winged helix-turn-helix transcriptional regulator n=1 Tax=Microbacterium sp. LRZ72 TaxID=2942481 RepID=UPI0029BD5435|nr:MarR family transcriptional regulator [Microbacterium sp. LRZ72]MDX2376331.1 MarR family transcriptional regulator [Microbacterium sp. LRZ72]